MANRRTRISTTTRISVTTPKHYLFNATEIFLLLVAGADVIIPPRYVTMYYGNKIKIRKWKQKIYLCERLQVYVSESDINFVRSFDFLKGKLVMNTPAAGIGNLKKTTSQYFKLFYSVVY